MSSGGMQNLGTTLLRCTPGLARETNMHLQGMCLLIWKYKEEGLIGVGIISSVKRKNQSCNKFGHMDKDVPFAK